MKKVLSFLLGAFMGLSVLASEPATMTALPEFPLDEAGNIALVGTGDSSCKPDSLASVMDKWAAANAQEFVMNSSQDVGTVNIDGSYVLADEHAEDGSRVVELLEYHVAASCDGSRYAYNIDSVEVYVVVMMPSTGQGYVDEDGMRYIVTNIVTMKMPDDYVTLVKGAFDERQTVRAELDGLLEQDAAKMKGNRLRRYNYKLQTAADNYAAADDYYRVVYGNYMASYIYLSRLAASLDAVLSAY